MLDITSYSKHNTTKNTKNTKNKNKKYNNTILTASCLQLKSKNKNTIGSGGFE